MDKKIAEEWIEDLRSGKYAQIKSNLHNRNGYCCLGVLSEQICNLPEVKETGYEYDLHEGCWYHPGTDMTEENTAIPKVVRKVIGLSDIDQRKYVRLNDRLGLSFTTIAQEIETDHKNG